MKTKVVLDEHFGEPSLVFWRTEGHNQNRALMIVGEEEAEAIMDHLGDIVAFLVKVRVQREKESKS